MLFHSSFRKELARSFGGTLVVLLTVIGTIALIRSFSFASKGLVDAKDLALVLGYTMVSQMPVILTLSLFISIVSTLSRMYRDHEMDIWLSAGQGLFGFLRPLFRFSWPVLAVIAVSSLFLWPWSNAQIADLKDRFQQRGDLERVEAGQFQESAGGERVFFVDKDSDGERSGKNVFISTQTAAKESVTSAQDGRVALIDNDRYVLLNSGQRVETDLKTRELKLSDFAEYGIKVRENIAVDPAQPPPRQVDTRTLAAARTPAFLGELSWRIGLVLTAANLIVLALAVSVVNPRAGRSNNLLFAMFAFIVYYNLGSLGQAWITSGKAKMPGFMLVLHGGILLLSVVWLYKRHIGFSFKSMLLRRLARRRSSASPN